MPLFGPPDVAKLKANRDEKGLLKAIRYPKEAGIRQAAAQALREIGRGDRASKAVSALADSRDARALEPAIALLKDRNPEVREAMAYALGRLRDARAVEPLIDALKQGGRASYSAAMALLQIGSPPVRPLIAALGHKDVDVSGAAAFALEELGSAAVEPLIAALKDDDGGVRKMAASVLGWLRVRRAVQPLIAALTDADDGVRKQAASALGAIGDARAVKSLIGKLKQRRGAVREAAADALDQLGWTPDRGQAAAWYWVINRKGNWKKECLAIGSAAVVPLIATLADKEKTARAAAANLLGQIGDTRPVEPLLAVLKDDPYARVEAAGALAGIGDARAVDPLMHMLGSGKYRERKAAAQGLVKLFQSGKLSDGQKRSILAQRYRIIERHSDGVSVEQCQRVHDDTGIGVDFPL